MEKILQFCKENETEFGCFGANHLMSYYQTQTFVSHLSKFGFDLQGAKIFTEVQITKNNLNWTDLDVVVVWPNRVCVFEIKGFVNKLQGSRKKKAREQLAKAKQYFRDEFGYHVETYFLAIDLINNEWDLYLLNDPQLFKNEEGTREDLIFFSALGELPLLHRDTKIFSSKALVKVDGETKATIVCDLGGYSYLLHPRVAQRFARQAKYKCRPLHQHMLRTFRHYFNPTKTTETSSIAALVSHGCAA